MRVLSTILLLASLAFAAPLDNFTNWNDYQDITGFRADSLKYGTAIPLTGAILNSLTAMANDTGSAGYASDSIHFTYGYRLGTVVLNSANKPDTAWGQRIVAGTFLLDSAHTITSDFSTNTDSLSGQQKPPVPGLIDTSSVTGYAVTSSPVSFFTAQLVQPWVKGGAGNRVASYVKVRLQLLQYLFVPTRVK